VSAKGVLAVLLGLVCLFFIWRHLGPLLRYLFPGRIRHAVVPGLAQPTNWLAKRLEAEGFRYLGTRTESLAWLWRHRAAVFAREGRVIADAPPRSSSRGAYLATFWKNGACAMTRVGTTRTVEGDGYLSRGVTTLTKVSKLLAHHYKTEGALGAQGDPVEVDSVEQRVELARTWYKQHGRTELGRAALLGGVLTASFVAFWVYAYIVLFR
jgi:hypothetical protein